MNYMCSFSCLNTATANARRRIHFLVFTLSTEALLWLSINRLLFPVAFKNKCNRVTGFTYATTQIGSPWPPVVGETGWNSSSDEQRKQSLSIMHSFGGKTETNKSLTWHVPLTELQDGFCGSRGTGVVFTIPGLQSQAQWMDDGPSSLGWFLPSYLWLNSVATV